MLKEPQDLIVITNWANISSKGALNRINFVRLLFVEMIKTINDIVYKVLSKLFYILFEITKFHFCILI